MISKKIIKLIFLPVIALNSMAQGDSLQKQINEQVWKPFIKSFNERDTDGFMAVHSKEMSRVNQDGKSIYGYEKYYEENKTGNERGKQSGRKHSIELRFIQRIAGNNSAFEVGYYKTTSFQPNGEARSFYGKFHVLMRKENGRWKILMDADANDKTDEAVFLTGKVLE
ncbi:MAG TPA: nuclear transport factor 2 family protein [Chitinophagaceae bacterium]|nr:nuclear transport factor 2 family protein [Chitinophagaceae bacterium]